MSQIQRAVLLVILICSCASQPPRAKQIAVDYGVSSLVSSFFHGDERAFYVQVGALDPIRSYTLGLHMAGWSGLNLHSLPARILNYFVMRPGQASFNQILGDSYTLAELCEKYYPTRPTVISLGPGYDTQKILAKNNWGKAKCIPDIFVLSKNKGGPAGAAEPANHETLTKMQYTNFLKQLTDSEVFIKDDVLEKYRKTYAMSIQGRKKKESIKIEDLLAEFSLLAGKQITIDSGLEHNNLWIIKDKEVVDVNGLIHRVHSLGKKQGSPVKQQDSPPIVLLNFRVSDNSLVLRSCLFAIEKIVSGRVSVFNLTVLSAPDDPQEATSVYIVDGGEEGDRAPKLVVLDQVCNENGRTGKFEVAGSYSSGQSCGLSLSDFIIEVAFSVSFLAMFFVFTTILLFYFCKSLKKQARLQEQALQFGSRVSQESELSATN